MKIYEETASVTDSGRIVECESIEKYFDEVMATHDFGDNWVPQIIISKPDSYGRFTCHEAAKGCDYVALIYDSWIE